ncbi:MAG: DUF5996 family protein [Candidatus Nitrosopolaris sp.]
MNHWWNSTLYITPHGLTTFSMYCNGRLLQIDFDFISHLLLIITTDNPTKAIALQPCSVAEFYQEIMATLRSLGIHVTIWTTPVEVPDRTPFEQDKKHTSYDPEYVQRFWRILAQTSRVLSEFRSRFIGKGSPVHFFWGAFDLAVTRFSGRPAPSHHGAQYVAPFVMVEAYSHEVSSCGFWPGGGTVNVSMLIPIPSLRVSRNIPSNQRRHSTMRKWESSCYLTMSCVLQILLMRFYWLSCIAPMKQLQPVLNGIETHWSVSSN